MTWRSPTAKRPQFRITARFIAGAPGRARRPYVLCDATSGRPLAATRCLGLDVLSGARAVYRLERSGSRTLAVQMRHVAPTRRREESLTCSQIRWLHAAWEPVRVGTSTKRPRQVLRSPHRCESRGVTDKA